MQEPEIGTTVLGKYTLVRELGSGGMGVVYLAEDDILDAHQFAIKIIRPEFADQDRFAQQFLREAKALLKVNHDAVARFYDLRKDAQLDRLCLVMEYVDGAPLSKLHTDGPLTAAQALDLVQRVAGGLQLCHQHGVIHRDIAPDNILLPDGDPAKAKLIDFGIARPPEVDQQTAFADADKPLKAAYASPEQLQRAANVGPESDIYSLGLVALRCIEDPADPVNRWPASLWDLTESRKQVPTIPAQVPAAFATLLRHMLDPDPAGRPTAKQVAEPLWPDPPAASEPPQAATNGITGAADRPGDWRQYLRPGLAALALLVIAYAFIAPRKPIPGSPPPSRPQPNPPHPNPAPNPTAPAPPQPAPGIAPLLKPVLSANPITAKKQIELTWTDASAHFSGQYSLYRCNSGLLHCSISTKNIGTTASPSLVDSDAQFNSRYDYWVVASAGGQTEHSNTVTDVTLPAASFEITGLSAQPANPRHDRIQLRWTGSGDPAEVTEYVIKRAGDPADQTELARQSGLMEYLDTEVGYNQTYQYTVEAIRIDDSISKAVAGPVTLKVPPYRAPRLEIHADGPDRKQLVLEWYSRSNPTFVNGFVVERAEDSGPWEPIKRLGGMEPMTVDAGLDYGKAYRYRVVPERLDGSPGSPSNEVQYSTPPPAPTDLTATPGAGARVDLTWRWSGKPVKEFQVFRTSEDYPAERSDRIGQTGDPSWTDPRPLRCRTNHYSVRAVSADGLEGPLSATKTADISVRPARVRLRDGCQVFDGTDLLLEWVPLRSCDFSAYRIDVQRDDRWEPVGEVKDRDAVDAVFEVPKLRSGTLTKVRFYALNRAGQAGPEVIRYLTRNSCRKRPD